MEHTFLNVEIITYEYLADHGEVLIQLIEQVWHRILPAPIKLQAHIWLDVFSRTIARLAQLDVAFVSPDSADTG